MAGAEMGVLRGVDNWEVYVRDGYTYFWHGSGGMALQLQHTVEITQTASGTVSHEIPTIQTRHCP